MPDFVPVDHDPFEGDASQAGTETAPKFVPVDHDPFTPGSIVSNIQAAMPVGSFPYRAVKATKQALMGTASDLATLGPIRRMVDASAEDASHPEAIGDSNYQRQGVAPAGDLMMMAMGSRMPWAEAGSVGVLGGKLNPNAIARAENMEAAGASPADIWSMTRTARGADGEWRQEISDAPSRMTIHPSELKNSDHFLTDALDHPELYQSYPRFEETLLQALPTNSPPNLKGRYLAQRNTIQLNPNLSPEEARSTLLHEIQHGVQDIEGFAPGDSPSRYIPAALGPAKSQFETVRDAAHSEIMDKFNTNQTGVEYMKDLIRREKYGPEAAQHQISEPFQKVFQGMLDKNPEVRHRLENIVDSEKLISDAETAAFQKYKQAMGEVESRNVQERLARDLYHKIPIYTEDTPRELQRDLRPKPKLSPVDYDPFGP